MVERRNPTLWELGLSKYPDIATTKTVVVDRFAEIPVAIPIPINSPPYAVHGFSDGSRFVMYKPYPSVRSRYAQLGIDISDDVISQIEKGLRYDPNLNQDSEPTPLITVNNYGARPILLKKGARLFRFYEEPDGLFYLQGDELVNAVESGFIKIQGEQLDDWQFSYGTIAGRIVVRAKGIFVRVKKEDRKWIPPHPDNKPIWIPDLENGYRGIIDSLLKPIPKQKDGIILWIGETVRMTLPLSIDAVLGRGVFREVNKSTDPKNQNNWGTQINSRLIDGGKTNWGVRVEILSENDPDGDCFVHFRFKKRVVKNFRPKDESLNHV